MKKGIFLITIICMISGLFITWQLKSQASQNANPMNQKNQALVGLIKELEKDITDYEEQLNSLRNELDDLEHSIGQRKSDLKKLQKSVHAAKLKAGLLPVKGTGILITLNDNKKGQMASPNDDPNRYIIHYDNILNIVSELKLAHAEAISINDQRVISTSEIRCVGNVILINTSRLAPPFEIKALGNADLLEEILLSGEYDLLKSLGFPVNYEIFDFENPLSIPAYSGTYKFNYIKEGE